MKIVAIGGGEIGRPGYSIETEDIDRETIKLTGKEHPKLLFLPTASGDSESYYEVVKNYFGNRLGCEIDVLYLFKENYSYEEIRKRILSSDIVYVGGGNTLRMLKKWRSLNVDEILKEAAEKGVVLSGVSAGANCWFKYSFSRFSGENSFVRLRGLNFIPLMCCPHYNTEKQRRKLLRERIKQKGGRAIALDNCTSFEFIDGMWRILTSKKEANAYLVYRKEGKVTEELLPKDGIFRKLEELL